MICILKIINEAKTKSHVAWFSWKDGEKALGVEVDRFCSNCEELELENLDSLILSVLDIPAGKPKRPKWFVLLGRFDLVITNLQKKTRQKQKQKSES